MDTPRWKQIIGSRAPQVHISFRAHLMRDFKIELSTARWRRGKYSRLCCVRIEFGVACVCTKTYVLGGQTAVLFAVRIRVMTVLKFTHRRFVGRSAQWPADWLRD